MQNINGYEVDRVFLGGFSVAVTEDIKQQYVVSLRNHGFVLCSNEGKVD